MYDGKRDETLVSLSKVKTIFFDYDGTIHDSIHIYAPAFQKAYDYLVSHNLAESKKWTWKEISYWLGFSPPEMWNTFMPDLREEDKQRCSKIIAEELNKQLMGKKPVLYDGALEVLSYLKRKEYTLIFISNCKTFYMESHAELFQLKQYFHELICSEQYQFKPKSEIIMQIKNNFPQEMVMVGDRLQDMEAGKFNHIYTIGCSYGFGNQEELKKADIIINNIGEIKNYL